MYLTGIYKHNKTMKDYNNLLDIYVGYIFFSKLKELVLKIANKGIIGGKIAYFYDYFYLEIFTKEK